MSGINKFLKAAGTVRKEAAVKPGKVKEKEKVPQGANPDMLKDPAAIEPGLKVEEEEAREIKNASAAITSAVELEMARRYQKVRNVSVR